MQIKKAFAAAAAKFPDRAAREALASFAARYSRTWPISNYRCTGGEAAVVEEFLQGCGLVPPDDYQMVASAREPGSAVVRWAPAGRVSEMCAELMAQLPDDGRRLELYMAQSAAAGDRTPWLSDASAVSPDASAPWDPLGLVAKTKAIAEEVAANPSDYDADVRRWADAYHTTVPERRRVTAPLWVLERTVAGGGLGLFRAAMRTSTGRTAAVPFAVGRYVKPDENLAPAFPMMANAPVINLLGDANLSMCSQLTGYVAVRAADLAEIPHDASRNVWMHVEDAYVDVARTEALSAEAVKTLADPNKLWPYVESIYEKAYGCAVRSVPGQSMVHVGPVDNDDSCGDGLALSVIDNQVRRGDALLVKPCLLFVPHGTSVLPDVVPMWTRGFTWTDEPGAARGWTRTPDMADYVGDAAAEWFAMTHCVEGDACPLPGAAEVRGRSATGSVSAEELRRLVDPAKLSPSVNMPPTVTNDGDEGSGRWSAVKHVVYGVLERMRDLLGSDGFVRIAKSKWSGPDKELHTAPYAVPAMYSAVRRVGAPEADDIFALDKPSEVTAALCALANPARQLGMPSGDGALVFDLVVETNIKGPPRQGWNDETTLPYNAKEAILNMFLHAFQNNERFDSNSWNDLLPGCNWESHRAMYSAIVAEFGRRSTWSSLWLAASPLSTETRAHGNAYDSHNGTLNTLGTRVRVCSDSYGRLVVAFRMTGAVAAVARAAFRWSAGLPLVTNETAELLVARNVGKAIDPASPSAIAELVTEHTSSDSPGVPGWTSWLGRYAQTRSTVPERRDYEVCAADAGISVLMARDVLA